MLSCDSVTTCVLPVHSTPIPNFYVFDPTQQPVPVRPLSRRSNHQATEYVGTPHSTDGSTVSVNSREGCVTKCGANLLNSSGRLTFARSPAKPVLTFVYTYYSSTRYILSKETHRISQRNDTFTVFSRVYRDSEYTANREISSLKKFKVPNIPRTHLILLIMKRYAENPVFSTAHKFVFSMNFLPPFVFFIGSSGDKRQTPFSDYLFHQIRD